jgi:hypothetical protein
MEREEQENQAITLIEFAHQRGIELRLIGGIAVALRCPSASHRSLKRKYADIDVATRTHDGKKLNAVFEEFGYHADKSFNALQGKTRRLYHDDTGENQIDVFISKFEMCHEIPLGERIELEDLTLTLTDLLLTKAQVVEMNTKDMLDLVAILADKEVADRDRDAINGPYIAGLLARDWGLHRTITGSLRQVQTCLPELDLDPEIRARASANVGSLFRVIDSQPKTRGWKLRAKVGDRVQWYELPEDPGRRGQSLTAAGSGAP